MNNTKWDKLHNHYKAQDWIDTPNIFAKDVVRYFPKSGKILELGAGQGQDSRFFASQGYCVVSTDISDSALEMNRSKNNEQPSQSIQIQKVDLTQPLPFENESFDVVYAHLSLHYFDYAHTKELILEIYRVLRKDGIFATFTNTIEDDEYGKGVEIEKDYFLIDGVQKRYFSTSTLRALVQSHYDIVLLDNFGETYKDAKKGVHNLIRFIGQKKKFPHREYDVPCVGAIIEREKNGVKEILIQKRWKPDIDPLYSGTFELPAGVLDKPFEHIYETVRREIREETGLTLKSIKSDSQTDMFSPRNDSSFGFRPFCCVQQLSQGRPWIGFIFVCEVEEGEIISQQSEAKEAEWISVANLQKLFVSHPEQFFTLELPALSYYLKSQMLQ